MSFCQPSTKNTEPLISSIADALLAENLRPKPGSFSLKTLDTWATLRKELVEVSQDNTELGKPLA